MTQNEAMEIDLLRAKLAKAAHDYMEACSKSTIPGVRCNLVQVRWVNGVMQVIAALVDGLDLDSSEDEKDVN